MFLFSFFRIYWEVPESSSEGKRGQKPSRPFKVERNNYLFCGRSPAESPYQPLNGKKSEKPSQRNFATGPKKIF